VIALTGPDQAVVDLGGIRKPVNTALVPDAAVGDYLVIHVGHAIGRIDPEEAERTLALFGELQALEAASGPSAGPLPSRPAIPSGDRPTYPADEGRT
jgi:hydrogenase expression/formation protein HypC